MSTTAVCLLIPMLLPRQQIAIVIGRGMVAYSFIMIGYAGKQLFLSEKTKNPAWMFGALAATASIAIIGLKYGGNDLYSCSIRNPITFALGGISGTVLILGISRIVPCRMVSTAGNHTLTIMGTHQLIIYTLCTLIPTLCGGSLLDGFMLFAVILIVEAPAVNLIEQFLPFFVGKKCAKTD